jgi:hypothetical protein
MKKSLTIAIAPASLAPMLVTTKIAEHTRARKAGKKGILHKISPPTEETIKRLNGIAREYPFCVNYKSKQHDPL